MIVLGAATHKRSHTIAAVSAATGELLGERTVQVGRSAFGALRASAASLIASTRSTSRRAALREGLDSFPVAHLAGPELDLRLLVDHRERLVK